MLELESLERVIKEISDMLDAEAKGNGMEEKHYDL
jgi:hypothetical protein